VVVAVAGRETSGAVAGTPPPVSESAGWRVRADSYALVAATAQARGVNPRLVTLLDETAGRYREWSLDAARWEPEAARWWPGGQSPGG
jgi:hypothetical protein